jgi:hypothetical protein
MSSTCTDAISFNTADSLLFSFPFSHPPCSTEKYHYYKHILYITVYMIMFGFVYIFIFWICLPYTRKNIQLFSF